MGTKEMKNRSVINYAFLFSMLVSTATAQNGGGNPAFEPIVDNPDLPRVLLIGDSISIGYTLAVRSELAGVANVHRPPVNCGPTTRGLGSIDAWLGDKPWDVIHFNWGLHDLKFVDADGKMVDPAEGAHQVEIGQYQSNLRGLVERLRKTGAILIWCSTTPVPEGASGRRPGDEVRYNEAAEKVAQEAGIPIDDLYAFALPILADIQRPANVHFTDEGSKALARRVAGNILRTLTGD